MFYIKDSNNYFIHSDVNRLNYKFKDDVPEVKWDLIKEERTINNYKVKKATTNLFGREVIAWYTEDIPYQYGPYKFNGLPGLILELNDVDDNFRFELVDVKKDTTDYSSSYNNFRQINSSRKIFENKLREYKSNPQLIYKNKGIDTVKDNRYLKKKKAEIKSKNNSIERGFQFNL